MDINDIQNAIQGLPTNPLFNFGIGLSAASGPSLMPHSLSQGIAGGMEYSQQAQQRALQARMLQMQVQQQGIYNGLLQNAAGGQSGGAPMSAPSMSAGSAPGLASGNGTPGQSFSTGGSAPATDAMLSDPMSIMGMIKDAPGFFNAYYNRKYPQPTDFVKTLSAAGIDPQSEIGRSLIQQQIAKQNYQPPTSLRGGGYMKDPVTGQLVNLPQSSPGFQIVQDPQTGQFTEVPVAGGPEAVGSAAAAKAGGEAQFKLQKVWNPETQQYEMQPVSNVAAAANPGATTAPLRNNNPGAMMPGGQLAQYPDLNTGLKAIDDNLSHYGQQGINTVEGVISKWAPPTDGSGKAINNTPAYIADVSQRLGISPTQPIDLSNPAQRQALSTAIMLHENGPGAVFGQPSKKGAMAAEPALGAPQAAVSSKTATPESMQKDYETMLSQGPQTQQSLDALDKMLSLAQNKPWYLGGPAGVIPGVDRMSADAAEYEKQRANVIALMGKSLGGGGTDASRANIAESIPDYGKPKAAMLDGLQTQRNQVAVGQMRRQFLTPAYNSGDANKYTDQSNGFDQHIAPSMAPILQLQGEQQRQAVAAAIKANPALKSKFQWAFENGMLQ